MKPSLGGLLARHETVLRGLGSVVDALPIQEAAFGRS